jgi:putative hydrolase of HD superfamily
MHTIVHLFHEIGMLARIPRSGFAFLGAGRQSVAEHSFCATAIAYTLAELSNEPINMARLLLMTLFHDLPEARIGDLNYVQKKYLTVQQKKVLNDIEKASPLGPSITDLIQEYEAGKTIEAQLAHDADQLELILVLKYEHDRGSPKAMSWFQNAYQRLKTAVAKDIATTIISTSADAWWLGDQADPHWIDGGKNSTLD